jgi:hypothetical protein
MSSTVAYMIISISLVKKRTLGWPLCLGAIGALAAGTLPASAPAVATATPSAVTVSVGGPTDARPIPSGFVGLSLEQTALETYAGNDPLALNPVFLQLVRNIAPDQQPVLRIAGDSTDWTWYPVPGMKRPPWVRYTLTPGWLSVAHALVTSLNARLILGINLEADSTRIADAEAEAMVNSIGANAIDALELGNEPELYGSFNWFRTATGAGVLGRHAGYDFSTFARQFHDVAASLPRLPLAGPAIGSPVWSQQLPALLRANRRVSIATLHRYPLKRCEATTHDTAAQLLAASSSTGLAHSVAGYVRAAARLGDQLRIDEMNSISCGGQPGLSNSFASSLWALDALFAMASVDVSGVNIHTAPGTLNQLFSFKQAGGTWTAQVYPDYYGLLAFAQAAPPGAQLLRTAGAPQSIHTWATRATDGTVRVVLIDTAAHGTTPITVRLGGQTAPAIVEQLTASGLGATSGVTFGGQGFGSTTATGAPAGPLATTTIPSSGGTYQLQLHGASAAILTIPSAS